MPRRGARGPWPRGWRRARWRRSSRPSRRPSCRAGRGLEVLAHLLAAAEGVDELRVEPGLVDLQAGVDEHAVAVEALDVVALVGGAVAEDVHVVAAHGRTIAVVVTARPSGVVLKYFLPPLLRWKAPHWIATSPRGPAPRGSRAAGVGGAVGERDPAGSRRRPSRRAGRGRRCTRRPRALGGSSTRRRSGCRGRPRRRCRSGCRRGELAEDAAHVVAGGRGWIRQDPAGEGALTRRRSR
jgi:hypothetical protein